MSRAALDAPRTPVFDAPESAAPRPTSDQPPRLPGGRLRVWLTGSVVACIVLFCAYSALSLLNDPRGTLLADSGGKVATIHAMDVRGALDPDVGYWAAADDPNGELHAMRFTARVGDEWLQASTLPMLYASYPLYEVGGDRALLVLPMLGGVLCALAARALARRFGARTGWTAFWAVGLVTPVSLYAVSFWEHTLGLAAMLWGVVWLVDVARARSGWVGAWRAAAIGGALFGAAAVMRTEALVYFVVTVGVALVVRFVRDRAWSTVVASGVAALGGAAAVLVANVGLEVLTVESSVRAGRTASAAGAAGAATLADRLDQVATAATGLNGFNESVDWIVGAVIVALLGLGACALARNRLPVPFGVGALVTASLIYVLRVTNSLDYVPGFLVASPLAAVGLVLLWGRRDLWLPGAVALLALPLVWATAYSDTMRPQWGGRYTLTSGALLAVVSVVALAGRRAALAGVLVVSFLVTGYGAVFLSERSRSIADGMATIVARQDDAVISLEAHLLREGGAFYTPDRHWLTATDQGQLRRAVRIVREAGDDEFALLVPDELQVPATMGGFRRAGTQRVTVRPDQPLRVVTYRRR